MSPVGNFFFRSLIVNIFVSVAMSVGVFFLFSSSFGAPMIQDLLSKTRHSGSGEHVEKAGAGTPAMGESQDSPLSPEIRNKIEPLLLSLEKPAPTIQRLNVLIGMAQRLSEYSKAKGAFPETGGKLMDFVSAVPNIKAAGVKIALPDNAFANIKYISDGKSYKIIAVGTGDCAVVRAIQTTMVDPKRSAGPLDCIAYGVWTPRGVEF